MGSEVLRYVMDGGLFELVDGLAVKYDTIKAGTLLSRTQTVVRFPPDMLRWPIALDCRTPDTIFL